MFIKFSLVNMATTWGCSWSLVELVGSFLMNPPIIVFITFWDSKCGDGDNIFRENKKIEENYVFFYFFFKTRQIFLCIFPSSMELILVKFISFLVYTNNEGAYAWNLPPQVRNCAKNPCFLLQNISLPLL